MHNDVYNSQGQYNVKFFPPKDFCLSQKFVNFSYSKTFSVLQNFQPTSTEFDSSIIAILFTQDI